MADNPADPHVVAVLHQMSPYAPGLAGAILSMAVGEKLTFRGRALAGIVGLTCVFWVAPFLSALTAIYWPAPTLPVAALNFIGFVTGVFGFTIMAGAMQALAKYVGDPLRLVKFQFGPFTVGGGQ